MRRCKIGTMDQHLTQENLLSCIFAAHCLLWPSSTPVKILHLFQEISANLDNDKAMQVIHFQALFNLVRINDLWHVFFSNYIWHATVSFESEDFVQFVQNTQVRLGKKVNVSTTVDYFLSFSATCFTKVCLGDNGTLDNSLQLKFNGKTL